MAKKDTTISTVWGLVAILSIIAVVLMLMECARGPCTLEGLVGPRGKYKFSTVQKAVSPKAVCEGYLELDGKARPIAISFKLGPEGQKSTKWDFGIGQKCVLEEKTGASVYTDLTPAGKTPSSSQASLRFSKDKKMFMVTLTPPPPPWNIGLEHLSINIKNADGYEDWPILPPVKVCQSARKQKIN